MTAHQDAGTATCGQIRALVSWLKGAASSLRQTRADMLGTADDDHYFQCHNAADWIDQAIETFATLERDLTAAREALEKERDFIRKMDAVIDDEGIARSCVNPLEDLKRAIQSLKEALEAKGLDAKRWQADAEDMRRFQEACIRELYEMLGVDGSDGEIRFKWAALAVSQLKRDKATAEAALAGVRESTLKAARIRIGCLINVNAESEAGTARNEAIVECLEELAVPPSSSGSPERGV